MTRAPLWTIRLLLVILGFEAASFVVLRFIEREWTTPANIRSERLTLLSSTPIEEHANAASKKKVPYRLSWRTAGMR